MKLLQRTVLLLGLFLPTIAQAQSSIFTQHKSTIGGQNIGFVERNNSFVFSDKGKLYFYSVLEERLLDSITLSNDPNFETSGLAVNDFLATIALGGTDSLYIIDLLQMRLERTFPLHFKDTHSSTFNTLDFSDSGREFIYYDGTQILIKRVATWQSIDSIPYQSQVCSIDMYSKEKIFVAGFDRYGFDLFNRRERTCDSLPLSKAFTEDYFTPGHGRILSNGEIITMGFQGDDGLRTWRNKEPNHYFGYAGHAGDYNGFALSKDESLLVYAQYDIYSYDEDFAVLIKVIDLKSQELKHEIRIPMERQYDLDINSFAISHDGRFIAFSEFYDFQVWKLH